jgi:hypothetical protein
LALLVTLKSGIVRSVSFSGEFCWLGGPPVLQKPFPQVAGIKKKENTTQAAIRMIIPARIYKNFLRFVCVSVIISHERSNRNEMPFVCLCSNYFYYSIKNIRFTFGIEFVPKKQPSSLITTKGEPTTLHD